jgi:hypothetical protein
VDEPSAVIVPRSTVTPAPAEAASTAAPATASAISFFMCSPLDRLQPQSRIRDTADGLKVGERIVAEW